MSGTGGGIVLVGMGNCPGGNCPGANCPGGIVRGEMSVSRVSGAPWRGVCVVRVISVLHYIRQIVWIRYTPDLFPLSGKDLSANHLGRNYGIFLGGLKMALQNNRLPAP